MRIRCRCAFEKNVPDSYEGRVGECPVCQHRFVMTPVEDAGGSLERRRTERLKAERVGVYFGPVAGMFSVRDLDLAGLGFERGRSEREFAKGRRLTFDLYDGDKPVLRKVSAVTARTSSGVVGCVFEALPRGDVVILAEYLGFMRVRRVIGAPECTIRFEPRKRLVMREWEDQPC